MEKKIKKHENAFMLGEVVVGLKSRCMKTKPSELFPELEIAEIEDLYEPLVALFDVTYKYDPSYEIANKKSVEKCKNAECERLRKRVKKDKLDRLKKKSRTVYIVRLSCKSEESVLEAIELLKKNPLVAYAEPNYISSPAAIPDDPGYVKLWGMDKIQAPQAWDIAAGRHSVEVGVLDSGFYVDHPDLAANMDVELGYNAQSGLASGMAGYDIDDFISLNYNNEGRDFNGHGTHVAGTVGAAGNNSIGIAGVNWDVSMIPIKIARSNINPDSSRAIRTSAVEYATQLGLPVINMSYTIGASPDFQNAVNDYDGLLIIAAGNSAEDRDNDTTYTLLHALNNVLFVASTNERDMKNENSCYGVNTVDIAAPGSAIFSTIIDNVPSVVEINGAPYVSKGGTSMAAPHVAGAAALLLSVNPELTTSELKAALLDNADHVPALTEYVNSGRRLNVYSSLLSVLPRISFPDLDYNEAAELGEIEVSAIGSFKDRNYSIGVKKFDAAGIVVEPPLGTVSIDAAGTATYELPLTVNSLEKNEHIEISLYEDSSQRDLVSRHYVHPIVFSFG